MIHENYTNVNPFKAVYEQRQVASVNDVIEQPHRMHNAEGRILKEASSAKDPIMHGWSPYTNNGGTTLGKSTPLRNE